MKIRNLKHKICSVFMTLALAITLMAGFPAVNAYAASGSVYTCTVNRCYAHPVTGVIEDSGGEASYATGQGMVEGCVYSSGILEVTDSGEYYLTIRMSLMDYTSGHTFQVQNVGDSGWSTPSEIGVTGNGSDSNGSTADVCMRVPSENCVVRGSMYVEPMGRDVVFYVYPSDYKSGNSTDMNATKVTAASDSTAAQSSSDGSSSKEAASSESGSTGSSTGTGASSLTSGSLSSGNASLQSGSLESNTDTSSDNSQKTLQSSITEAAKPNSSTSDTESSTLNSAEGLSLSTAGESASDEESGTSGSHIFQVSLAVVICGLILIGAVAGIVYLFRRNWSRWGGAEDDDEE